MTGTARRAAGWYDDAADAAVLRYWDGTGWTPHTSTRPPLRAAAPGRDRTTTPARDSTDAVDAEPAVFATLRLPEHADGDAGDASALALDHATQRIEPREHTTVPTPPAVPDAQAPRPAQAERGPRAFAAASARPVVQLTVVGAVAAGASLVVACAALAVALAR